MHIKDKKDRSQRPNYSCSPDPKLVSQKKEPSPNFQKKLGVFFERLNRQPSSNAVQERVLSSSAWSKIKTSLKIVVDCLNSENLLISIPSNLILMLFFYILGVLGIWDNEFYNMINQSWDILAYFADVFVVTISITLSLITPFFGYTYKLARDKNRRDSLKEFKKLTRKYKKRSQELKFLEINPEDIKSAVSIISNLQKKKIAKKSNLRNVTKDLNSNSLSKVKKLQNRGISEANLSLNTRTPVSSSNQTNRKKTLRWDSKYTPFHSNDLKLLVEISSSPQPTPSNTENNFSQNQLWNYEKGDLVSYIKTLDFKYDNSHLSQTYIVEPNSGDSGKTSPELEGIPCFHISTNPADFDYSKYMNDLKAEKERVASLSLRNPLTEQNWYKLGSLFNEDTHFTEIKINPEYSKFKDYLKAKEYLYSYILLRDPIDGKSWGKLNSQSTQDSYLAIIKDNVEYSKFKDFIATQKKQHPVSSFWYDNVEELWDNLEDPYSKGIYFAIKEEEYLKSKNKNKK